MEDRTREGNPGRPLTADERDEVRYAHLELAWRDHRDELDEG